MKHCIQCKGTDLRHTEETVDVHVPTSDGELEVRVSGVSTIRCEACGEKYLSGPDLERADLLAAAEATRRGVHDGVTLKFIRKALGLRAAELGELLEVSAETVSRWENGHRSAERSVWNTLADLVADELAGVTTTRDRLRRFAEPHVPKTPVRLALAGAK